MAFADRMDRQRARVRGLRSDAQAALDEVRAGLLDIDARAQATTKAKRDDEDRATKAKALEGKAALDAAESQRKADEAKRRADADAEAARQKKIAEATARGARLGGVAHLNFADVGKEAAALGISPEDFLSRVTEEERKAAADESERAAKIEVDKARAEAARRGKPPLSLEEIEERARKRRREALQDEATQLQIEEARQRIAGTQPVKPTAAQGEKAAKLAAMATDVDNLEAALASVVESGLDPGKITGPVRAWIGKSMGDADMTRFDAFASAVNLGLFAVLRSDTPSDQENKMAEALKLENSDNVETLAAKLKVIRDIMRARANNIGTSWDKLGVQMPEAIKPQEAPRGARSSGTRDLADGEIRVRIVHADDRDDEIVVTTPDRLEIMKQRAATRKNGDTFEIEEE